MGFYKTFLQLTRNCISKPNISGTKIYLTPKYNYTHAVETSQTDNLLPKPKIVLMTALANEEFVPLT